MNKYEQALENIGMIELDRESNGYDDPKYLKDFYYGEYCVLKELVDRATPKRCKFETVETTETNTLEKIKIIMFVCPNCNQTIGTRLNNLKFCPNCGQILD